MLEVEGTVKGRDPWVRSGPVYLAQRTVMPLDTASRRPAVVDPAIGVRREPYLRDPRPHHFGRSLDAQPRLQPRGGDEAVARLGAHDLVLAHAPPVTSDASIFHDAGQAPDQDRHGPRQHD